MIDVKKLAPGIILDIRYASTNNFTKKKHYLVEKCLLCEPAAKRLARVQKNLEKNGLGLKVWDCYRPLSVQKKLWDTVSDPRYVADPKKGSRHNRGASVDLTLVDKNGHELPMPTEYDDFSEKAHRNYNKLSKEKIKNRQTLEKAMEAEGFIGLPTEWWHFDAPEWESYALRNEPLESDALLHDKSAPPIQIPLETKQLITVITSSTESTTGTLQRWERLQQKWEKVGVPWPVSIGSGGLTSTKTEGDKKAPAGIFNVGAAYGDQPPSLLGLEWPYTQVDENWVCVDDPTSRHYNNVFKVTKKIKKDWASAEKMKRKDHLYKYVINIEYNYPEVNPGSGSCIFFHVWRGENSPTRGCTAMDEKNIVTLLQWLKTSAHPILVQLTQSHYAQHQKNWKLP